MPPGALGYLFWVWNTHATASLFFVSVPFFQDHPWVIVAFCPQEQRAWVSLGVCSTWVVVASDCRAGYKSLSPLCWCGGQFWCVIHSSEVPRRQGHGWKLLERPLCLSCLPHCITSFSLITPLNTRPLLGSSWDPDLRCLAYLAETFEALTTLIMQLKEISTYLICQYFVCQEIISQGAPWWFSFLSV